ncbi:hypothetical protein VTH06DRAFT_7092 [Thermothelomyces fergusii]
MGRDRDSDPQPPSARRNERDSEGRRGSMREEPGDCGRERAAKRRRVGHEEQQEHERHERHEKSCTPGEEGEGGRGRERDRQSTPRGDRHHSHRHRHRHHSRDGHSHRHRHRSSRRHSADPAAAPKELPFGARQLSRGDLASFRPLFAYYLDLQKQLDIDSLDEIEVRGRWKSFVGKWNRGELAEGWYDPDIFQKSVSYYAYESPPPSDSPSRREEMERARRAEREERLREYREREERVIAGLRELARQRFGVP